MQRHLDAATEFDGHCWSAAIEANHRQLVEHGFNDGVSAGIVQAGKEENIEFGISGQHLFARETSFERDTLGKAKVLDLASSGFQITAVADDGKSGLGAGAVQSVQGDVDSFESDDFADEEKFEEIGRA